MEPTTASTTELPTCTVEELPADVQGLFRALLSGNEAADDVVVLRDPRPPQQLHRSYLIAQSLIVMALVGSVVLGVWLSWAFGIGAALMIGIPALLFAVLLQFIWVGPRRALSRDPLWCCGLASQAHLVMRDRGALRCLALEPFEAARVHVFKTEGVENRKIVLSGSNGEIAWEGLEDFGSEVVGNFAYALHSRIQAGAQARRFAAMDITEILRNFAHGQAPPEPIRFCAAGDFMLHGGSLFEVFGDGRVVSSRWDPVAAEAIPLAQIVLPMQHVQQLARDWLELEPTFDDLPQFIPSLAGTLNFSVACGDKQQSVQVCATKRDEPVIRGLTVAFDRVKRLLPPA